MKLVSVGEVLQGLRDRFGQLRRNDGQPFELLVDLAPMGTSERVQQLKRLEREFQRMLEDAADAYKLRLRG